jgi:hypothetical protein
MKGVLWWCCVESLWLGSFGPSIWYKDNGEMALVQV